MNLNDPVFDPMLALDAEGFAETPWAQAIGKGDKEGAVAAYVAELRSGRARMDLDDTIPRLYGRWTGRGIGMYGGHRLDADLVLQKRYIGCYGIEHRFEGEIDWYFDPTKDWGERHTAEWQVQLNRHYQWVQLADAYLRTGDERYARHWEWELRSWIAQCPRPARLDMRLPGTWRTIDVGIRAGWSWPHSFEIFRTSKAVADEALWMLACMMRQHGIYLLNYPRGRNFKTMETNGLAHAGFMFYDMADGFTFATTAVDRAIAELERQFYPDGCQDELAPSYALVAFSNLYSALRLAQRFLDWSGKPGHWAYHGMNIPPTVWRKINAAVEVLGRIADPDGICPDLHDSGVLPVEGLYNDFARRDPERFAKRPWKSVGCDLVPYGGYAMMRRADRWALLDAGPFGTGHQHHDCLELLLHAHGQAMAVDPGKPLYDTSPQTKLLRSSSGHNVVQMDGLPHRRDPRQDRADEPLPIALQDTGEVYVAAAKRRFVVEPGFSAQRNVDGPVVGAFAWERLVLDLEDVGWLVFDCVVPEDVRPHRWEWLWHLPGNVEVGEKGAVARYANGTSLRIASIGPADAELRVAAGQNDPMVRGWRVNAHEKYEPLPVLLVTSAPQVGPMWRVTLLAPAAGTEAPIELESAELEGSTCTARISAPHGRWMVQMRGDGQIHGVQVTMPDGRPRGCQLPAHSA